MCRIGFSVIALFTVIALCFPCFSTEGYTDKAFNNTYIVSAVIQNPANDKGQCTADTSQFLSKNTMIQFTAGEHVLGFGKDRMMMANGTHALTTEFVGASCLSLKAEDSSEIDGNTLILSKVTYSDIWKGKYYKCKELCRGHEIDYYKNGNKRLEGRFKKGWPRVLKYYGKNGDLLKTEKFDRHGTLTKTVKGKNNKT